MVGFPPPGFPMYCWVCSQAPNIPGFPWELQASSLGPFLAVELGCGEANVNEFFARDYEPLKPTRQQWMSRSGQRSWPFHPAPSPYVNI